MSMFFSFKFVNSFFLEVFGKTEHKIYKASKTNAKSIRWTTAVAERFNLCMGQSLLVEMLIYLNEILENYYWKVFHQAVKIDFTNKTVCQMC